MTKNSKDGDKAAPKGKKKPKAAPKNPGGWKSYKTADIDAAYAQAVKDGTTNLPSWAFLPLFTVQNHEDISAAEKQKQINKFMKDAGKQIETLDGKACLFDGKSYGYAPKPTLTVQPEASAALERHIAQVNAMSAPPDPKPKKAHPMTVKRKPAGKKKPVEPPPELKKVVEAAKDVKKVDGRKRNPPKIFDAPELKEGEELKDPTPQQKHFCQNLLANGYNYTQAAIDAGYSHKSAKSQASDILTRPHILRYLADLQKPMVEALDISAERILREYASMAFGNDHDFVKKDENGKLVVDENGLPLPDFTNATRDQMAGLAGLEITILPSFGEEEDEHGNRAPNPLKIKWKRQDKKAALDVLAKRAGVIVDPRVKLEGKVELTLNDQRIGELLGDALSYIGKAEENAG